ncbi:MAG: hypothetical protein ACI4FZ_08795 [Lachnospiraceae bacterium]
MTDEERARRKKIWDSMTEEERQTAEQERRKIIDWETEECEKARRKIKEEGRYIGGLDGYYPEYEEISKERNRRYKELLTRLFGEGKDG